MTWLTAQLFGDTAKLFVRDNIGLGDSAEELLAPVQKAEKVVCVVDSCGGDGFAGCAVHDFLRQRDSQCLISNRAYSSGAIVALGARTIRMERGAKLMIHEAQMFVAGPARLLRERAAGLDTLNAKMVDMLVQRTGYHREAVSKWCGETDTYFDDEQALELGLIDEIVAPEELPAVSSYLRHKLAEQAEAETNEEQLLKRTLEAIGKIPTKDRHKLFQYLNEWFARNVPCLATPGA